MGGGVVFLNGSPFINFAGVYELYKNLFLFIAVLLISSIANAFVVSTDSTYLPYAYYNEDGKLVGFEIDVIRALEKELNEKAEIIEMEYPGALVGLTTGKIDLIITVDASDLKKGRVKLTEPIMNCGLTIATSKDRKDINKEEDVKGKNIGVVQGTVGAYVAEQHFDKKNIVYFESNSTMYDSVLLGKVDVVINDSVTNDYYIKIAKNKKPLKIISKEFEKSPGLSAVSLKHPELFERVQAAYHKFEKDGTFSKIRKKWNFSAK